GDSPDEMGDHLASVRFQDGIAASAIAAGKFHSCALVGTHVECWGYNEVGQIGVAPAASVVSGPQRVELWGPVVKISAGFSHTCAILENGAVKCWGSNYFGQLGIGTMTDLKLASQAVNVQLQEPALMVAAGGSHTCAVVQSGAVKCWGYNDYG